MARIRHLATALIIAFTFALCLKIDTTMARGQAGGAPPNTEFSQEHGQISACTNNCKDDGMCILQCFKKTLDVMNVDRRSKFMRTDKIHLRSIMCAAGCVISDICPEVDEAGELSIDVLSVTTTISCCEIVFCFCYLKVSRNCYQLPNLYPTNILMLLLILIPKISKHIIACI